MATAPLAEYTLLLIGLAILLIVSVSVVLPNLAPTPWGRLNRQRRELRHRQYQHHLARLSLDKARSKFSRLNDRSEHVKPQVLREAEEQVQDLQTMLGHAEEKVMVAENHVRRIVLDEYPPVRQEQLLKKFLPESSSRKMSSTF